MLKNLCSISYALTALTLITVISSKKVRAQDDISDFFKSSPADAQKLAVAYLNPLFKGFGTGLNSGWNNSAKSKNMLRFELRLGATGAIVPSSDKSFDVTKIGLSNNIRPANTSQTMAPTVAAKSGQGPEMVVYQNNTNNEVARFRMPEGANLPLIPGPQLQATLGLPKGIDVTLRAMPKINLGEEAGSIGMIGGGLKIELLPLFVPKTVDKLFPLDLALAVGYTQFTYNKPLDVQPGNAQPASPQDQKDFSTQRIDGKFSGVNVEAIVSKKLALFTPFLSVGYQTAKTEISMLGNYPFVTDENLIGQPTYVTFTDPIKINQKDLNGFRTNLGFQLNLAFFRIYASYTMADYNAVNAGIGFGIGK